MVRKQYTSLFFCYKNYWNDHFSEIDEAIQTTKNSINFIFIDKTGNLEYVIR